MTAPDEAAGPAGSPRRVVLWAVVIAAALGLLVFVPEWAWGVRHRQQAGELVDRSDRNRGAVLETARRIAAGLEPLGEPARSWSEVQCWLTPRHSDGDGEADVIVSYGQECSPVAYEAYPLPAAHRSPEQAAALLGGRLGRASSGCDRLIFGVPGTAPGDPAAADRTVFLRWVEPGGRGACDLPAPGGPGAARVRETVARPLTASAYVVLEVAGRYERVDVGCTATVGWLGTCTGPPQGAPYLPRD